MTRRESGFPKDRMYLKFRLYGFLKNLRFFDPFLILFFREVGLSFLEIGVLFSIREIATTLLEVPTGILADTYGRRRAMLAAFSAYLAAFAVFYLVPRFWALALAMVLFAFGETFRSGTHKAMILDHLRLRGVEDRRVAYYGRTRAASQLGSAVAALIAGGLVFYTGSYRIVFLASIVPYVGGLLLLASYPRELDGDLAPIEGSAVRAAARRLRDTVAALGRLFRNPLLLRGLLNSAGFDAAFKSTKDYLQPIVQAQALALPILLAFGSEQRTALLIGIVYFLIHVGASWASARAGWASSRSGSPARAANAAAIAGLGLLAAAGLASMGGVPGVAIGGFIAVFMIQNLRRPLAIGTIAELVSHRMMATGLSIEVQIRTLIMAGLAPMLGWLADRFGVGAAVLAVSAAMMVMLILVPLRSPTSGEA